MWQVALLTGWPILPTGRTHMPLRHRVSTLYNTVLLLSKYYCMKYIPSTCTLLLTTLLFTALCLCIVLYVVDMAIVRSPSGYWLPWPMSKRIKQPPFIYLRVRNKYSLLYNSICTRRYLCTAWGMRPIMGPSSYLPGAGLRWSAVPLTISEGAASRCVRIGRWCQCRDVGK